MSARFAAHAAVRLVCYLGAVSLLASGCAHAPIARPTGPTVELALDEGAPSERPLIGEKTFETLMRFDPRLASYRPRQLRFLVAQAGTITFNVYANSADRPGASLLSVERAYSPGMCSDGKDGKWVIEDLSRLGAQTGPVWIGISSHGRDTDPRLWATSNNSGAVFARDADPASPFTTVPRTPIVRLELSPSE